MKAADTAANQAAFPQHRNQAKGAGFPILRLMTVMSLTVGTVIGYAVGAYKGKGTSEAVLLRNLADCIEKDDMILGNDVLGDEEMVSHCLRIRGQPRKSKTVI